MNQWAPGLFSCFTVSLLARLFSNVKPAAGKAIDILVRAGVPVEVAEHKLDRQYRHDNELQLPG